MDSVKRRTLSASMNRRRLSSATARGQAFDKSLFIKRPNHIQSLNATFVESSSHPQRLHKAPQENSALVEKLRNRREKSTKDEISTELAAKVVKRFILPMFEADTRQQQDRQRSAAFGLANKHSVMDYDNQGDSSTVYGELKLSEQLTAELLRQKDELEELNGRLTDALQEKAQVYKDYVQAKDQVLRLQSDICYLGVQFDEVEKEGSVGKFVAATASHLLQETQRLCKSLQDEKNALHQEMHTEKSLNDKLRNRATELEVVNSLLRMENDIMGEHLKGMYQALNNLVNRKGLEDSLSFEVKRIAASMERYVETTTSYTDSIANLGGELDAMRQDFADSMALRSDYKSQLEKLSNASKERIKSLSVANKQLTEERDKLVQDNLKLAKNYKDLAEEHDKIRLRIKQYMKTKLVGEVEEQQCKNCQKAYFDTENFNWSCKTHSSEYSGDLWWCCGKTERNAVGCNVGKHVSREDADTDFAKKSDLPEAAESASRRCSSCRETGHAAKDCPKDPNMRTIVEIHEEVSRVSKFSKNKRKGNVIQAANTGESAMQLMSEILGESAFGVEFDSETSMSSDDSDRDLVFFPDIRKMRRKIQFDKEPNRYVIEQLKSKELEKEELLTKAKHKKSSKVSLSPPSLRVHSPNSSSSYGHNRPWMQASDGNSIQYQHSRDPSWSKTSEADSAQLGFNTNRSLFQGSDADSYYQVSEISRVS